MGLGGVSKSLEGSYRLLICFLRRLLRRIHSTGKAHAASDGGSALAALDM